MDRRDFIFSLTASAGFCSTAVFAGQDDTKPRHEFKFGCSCGGSSNDVKMLSEAGFDFCEMGVSSALNPRKDNDWWKNRAKEISAFPIPLLSCNGFLPGSFRLTGPNADLSSALDYAETVLRRAEEVGVKYIVFGSGGARNVPGDMLGDYKQRPNIEKALLQFTEFCKRLCDRVDDLKDVSVVIEPLRPNESNIINYVWQGQQICEDVKSPRLNLLADIYHMMMGRESAESIVNAGALLKHCHVANYGNRSFPGSDPSALSRIKPYFEALRKIGYRGGISCECAWGKLSDRRTNYETALKAMKAL